MVSHRRERAVKERRIPTGVWVVAFVFVAGLGYIGGTFNTQIFSAIGPMFGLKSYAGSLDLSSLQTTYQLLKANYDGTLDDKTLIEGANKGMVDSLGDEYTVYLNQKESEDFDNSLSGTIGGGVGIELSMRDKSLTIVRLLKDNPAEKAGMMVGDIVVAVNDEAVGDQTTEQIVSKIRGDIGTTVKLTVLRGTDTKDFTLTRANINNPSVYSTIQDGVGVLTIIRFDSQTGELAKAAARDFKSKGVKSVVLDLRGNGGGYVTAAQDVAGLWLDNKIVVSERTNGQVVDELRTGRDPILAGLPTVVLVDASSASASEIVAGALHDYKVAKLVGEKTFGKGSVQKLLNLPGGGELKVTVARWYTPNGANISKQGITPDVTVALTPDDINAGRDPQLDAAKAALK